MMEVQKKETGQVFWACQSCMNFASSITTKVQEVDRKVEELRGQVAENKEGVDKANENVRKMEKKVEKVEKKMEDGQQRMEDIMYEEMRAREAIRRNVVIYGVEEPSTQVLSQDWRERNREEAHVGWNDIGTGQNRTTGCCKRTTAHSLQEHQHRTGPDEEAKAGGEKIARGSGKKKQGRTL